MERRPHGLGLFTPIVPGVRGILAGLAVRRVNVPLFDPFRPAAAGVSRVFQGLANAGCVDNGQHARGAAGA